MLLFQSCKFCALPNLCMQAQQMLLESIFILCVCLFWLFLSKVPPKFSAKALLSLGAYIVFMIILYVVCHKIYVLIYTGRLHLIHCAKSLAHMELALAHGTPNFISRVSLSVASIGVRSPYKIKIGRENNLSSIGRQQRHSTFIM